MIGVGTSTAAASVPAAAGEAGSFRVPQISAGGPRAPPPHGLFPAPVPRRRGGAAELWQHRRRRRRRWWWWWWVWWVWRPRGGGYGGASCGQWGGWGHHEGEPGSGSALDPVLHLWLRIPTTPECRPTPSWETRPSVASPQTIMDRAHSVIIRLTLSFQSLCSVLHSGATLMTSAMRAGRAHCGRVQALDGHLRALCHL